VLGVVDVEYWRRSRKIELHPRLEVNTFIDIVSSIREMTNHMQSLIVKYRLSNCITKFRHICLYFGQILRAEALSYSSASLLSAQLISLPY
jgi:hypothetical protein